MTKLCYLIILIEYRRQKFIYPNRDKIKGFYSDIYAYQAQVLAEAEVEKTAESDN